MVALPVEDGVGMFMILDPNNHSSEKVFINCVNRYMKNQFASYRLSSMILS